MSDTPQHDTDAAALLSDLLARGFRVRGEGQQLYVEPRAKLTAGDGIAVRTWKAERLGLLDHDLTGQDIRLTLRPLRDTVPAVVRLRRALKCLLRSFGLKCVGVEQVPRNRTEGDTSAGAKKP